MRQSRRVSCRSVQHSGWTNNRSRGWRARSRLIDSGGIVLEQLGRWLSSRCSSRISILQRELRGGWMHRAMEFVLV
jgi:hypothetical protein